MRFQAAAVTVLSLVPEPSSLLTCGLGCVGLMVPSQPISQWHLAVFATPMISHDSEQLVAALMSPAAFDHPVEAIELLETHISWIVLTGAFAYKIKKPVDFGFLNFSTLEKRRHFCQEEVRLNRRLAPELYLGVAAIAGSIGEPRMDGSGEAVEYAVKMRQFSQDALLSELIAKDQLTAEHVDACARRLAAFHQQIARADDLSPFGGPDHVLQPTVANFEAIKSAEAGDPAWFERIRRLEDWTRTEHARLRSVFVVRKQDGFVRECHGDAHLGNIILLEGRVTPFDCIEFSESLRWIDVMSEIAFLVMDLEDRGRPDFAQRVLDTYLSETGDYDGLAVLPFYLTYRALVRAKVACLRMRQEDVTDEERPALQRELDGYMALAQRYVEPRPVWLAITHGPSGSGKTYGTQPLIEREGAIRIRSDVERKRLFGLPPEARSDETAREQLYSADATERTYTKLETTAESIVQSGFPVVADATFLRRAWRDRFRALAERLEVPFRILNFTADEDELRRRIKARRQANSDASEADFAILKRQLDSQEPLGEDEVT